SSHSRSRRFASRTSPRRPRSPPFTTTREGTSPCPSSAAAPSASTAPRCSTHSSPGSTASPPPPEGAHVSTTAVLRRLGPSDLDVHPICLGGNTFGWTTDRDASFAVLDAYVAAGGNFVDSADAYSRWVPGNSGGESETILGEWLSRSGRRDDVVVATKVG